MAKGPSKEELEQAECVRLNELARLYPWYVFDQRQLEIMTGHGRAVISAAFADPQVSCQFGKSRPEEIRAWVERQPRKCQTKEAKDLVKLGDSEP